MATDYGNWKRDLGSGVIAGIIWGWIAMAVVAMTMGGLENGMLRNLVSFSVGGAVFGIAAGGLLTLTHDWLPFKSSFGKAVLLTTFMWLALRVGGLLLSSIDSFRYHAASMETVRGLMLAVLMGCVLGTLRRVWLKR
ncbi:MAG: hypothetical protein AAB065_05190 [Deltaproteobacteria bacterium]